MFFVYILYSESVDRFYVGHTNNVERRFDEHKNPRRKNKFTAKIKDWRLVKSFSVGETRSEAILVEQYIKRQKSRKYIEQLIITSDKEIIDLLVRVPTCRD